MTLIKLLTQYDSGEDGTIHDIDNTIEETVQVDNSEISANGKINVSNKPANHFRMIEHNINSLKGKKEELKGLIETERPDCLVLVGTKLNPSFKNIRIL